ncbi:hypothetical protein [Gordonia sihwensis]|uniref:hypothetical protein n=1 Tax=Gordonia sihwensis TaxID=173559 RepID=UPI0005EE1408|nr:hypothetical protein [Gordonia sihwensis]KJR10260.1 hypothetical protein UG54_01385 [Gordonia sihwensis]
MNYEREVRVPGGRVDFVVGTVAIEVKIKGSSESLSRQLQRYVEAGRFTAIIVATTRPAHHVVADPDRTPPITVVTLGGLGL